MQAQEGAGTLDHAAAKSMNEVCFAGMEEFNEEVSSSEKSRIRIGQSESQSSDCCVCEARTRRSTRGIDACCSIDRSIGWDWGELD